MAIEAARGRFDEAFYQSLPNYLGVYLDHSIERRHLKEHAALWDEEESEATAEAEQHLAPSMRRPPRVEPFGAFTIWQSSRLADAARPFQPHFTRIVDGVNAGMYRTQQDIADQFRKYPSWVTELRRVAVQHHCITNEAWWAGLALGKQTQSQRLNTKDIAQP